MCGTYLKIIELKRLKFKEVVLRIRKKKGPSLSLKLSFVQKKPKKPV